MLNMDIVTEKGEHKKIDVIAVFHNDNNKFVAYNDGSKTDGKLNIIVSSYEEKDGDLNLYAIEKDEEWDFINNYLDENVFGGDNDE